MDCQLCQDPFSVEEKKPIKLNCGHTFCLVCVASKFENGHLECPICHLIHTADTVDAIPVHVAILNSLTSSALQDKSNISAEAVTLHGVREPEIHCGICTEHGSYKMFYCNTCQVWLCTDCIVVDHQHRPFSVLSAKQRLEEMKIEGKELLAKTKGSAATILELLNQHHSNLDARRTRHSEAIKLYTQLIEAESKMLPILDKKMGMVQSSIKEGEITLEEITSAYQTVEQAKTFEQLSSANLTLQSNSEVVNEWVESTDQALTNCTIENRSVELSVESTATTFKQISTDISHMASTQQIPVKTAKTSMTFVVLISKFAGIAKTMISLAQPILTERFKPDEEYPYIWTVTEKGRKVAPITFKENYIHIPALEDSTSRQFVNNEIILPYRYIRLLLSPPITGFMEITWGGENITDLYMEIGGADCDENAVTSFMDRCTAEEKESFVNSSNLVPNQRNSSCKKGLKRLFFGLEEPGSDVKEPHGVQFRPGEGWVTLATQGNKTGFSIWLTCPDIGYQMIGSYQMIGKVTSGLDALCQVGIHGTVPRGVITKCELILK